jgi:GxxExxY protein
MKQLSGQIIGAAIKILKALGPGLLESNYEECLCHEFIFRGLRSERQKSLPAVDKGLKLDCGYRNVVVVADKVILELKSVDSLLAIHEAQLLTCLKLMNLTLGLWTHFNSPLFTQGIKRIVNNYHE